MGIRIFGGIHCLISDIIKFEHTRTKITDPPMPMALLTDDEVANTGQSPNIKRNTGFSLGRPLWESIGKKIQISPTALESSE